MRVRWTSIHKTGVVDFDNRDTEIGPDDPLVQLLATPGVAEVAVTYEFGGVDIFRRWDNGRIDVRPPVEVS